MTDVLRLAAAASFLILTACSTAGPEPTPAGHALGPSAASLAGTTWELQEIASMDDSQGSVRPTGERPVRVHFGTDGRASFQLDCNRGTAQWTAQPAPDGESGSLRFGAIGLTRAMCPPPTLEPRIARDLEAVRSYLVRDGILSMSLMTDGGMYRWKRAREENPGR